YKNYFYYLDICTKIDALFNIIKDFSLKVNRKHFLFSNKAFHGPFHIILSYNIMNLKLRLTNTVMINVCFINKGRLWMIPIRIEKTTKLIVFILLIIIFFYFIKMTIGYIYPFIIAILLTILLKPVVSLGEKYLKLNRGLAVFSVMMSVFCSLIIFLFIFTDMMIRSEERRVGKECSIS